MIQLNTEREIQAWVQFAAGRGNHNEANDDLTIQELNRIADYADAMLERLRQRIVQEKDTEGKPK